MSGPVTIDTSSLMIGLAQVRVGASATNIAFTAPVLSASDSVGAMADVKFVGNTDWYKHEAGFPLLEDYTVPIREGARIECGVEEGNPFNFALAYGIDPTGGTYANTHSGEVVLGGRTAPAYVRCEVTYTYPNGENYMYIIGPRAQVTANIEMEFQKESNASVPIMFEFKTADSNVSGGSAVWDNRPLGRIFWS